MRNIRASTFGENYIRTLMELCWNRLKDGKNFAETKIELWGVERHANGRVWAGTAQIYKSLL